MVTSSPSASSVVSSTATTVNCRGWLQSPGVKTRSFDPSVGPTPTLSRASSAAALLAVTVTAPAGLLVSFTVNASPAPPSATVTAVFDSASPAESASVVRAFAVTEATAP